MKNIELVYLNTKHEHIIKELVNDVKKCIYYATDGYGADKYLDFVEILDSVFLYSNNFHNTTYKIDKENGVMAEFLFLIPNTLFYTTIGFLTALKNKKNENLIYENLKRIGSYCEDATSELTDVLISEKEKNKLKESIEKKTHYKKLIK